MGTLFVDKLDPQSGTSLEIGSSGDTITIPSGCTITNNGTQSGFGGVNTPAFASRINGTQAIAHSTSTKLQLNTEIFDTASAFDTSTIRFTPQTAGKYYCTLNINFDGGGQGNLRIANAQIYFNGALAYISGYDKATGYENNSRESLSAIITFNGSSDYIEPYAYAYTQNSGNITMGGSNLYDSQFSAFKIIE